MTTHKGKKSLSDSNFQRRRRRPRFFLCGICNVVSVAAENPQPHHGTGNETDSAQERCSEEEFSKGPTQGQSHLVKEKGGRTRKRLENFKSTRITKVCWNGGGDNDHEKDHSWSSFDQLSLRTSRNDIKQGRSIFHKGTQREAKLASDSHQSVKGKKNDHRLEVDSTPKSQKAFQRQCTMDSSESTKSQPLTNETSFQEPAAEATEASDKPVLPINDSVAKPAWVAVDEKTNVPGRRWRKALALRANGKRLKETRDLAAVYEEYDLMIHNLKQFGVL